MTKDFELNGSKHWPLGCQYLTVLWTVHIFKLYSLIEVYLCFGGIYCLQHQGQSVNQADSKKRHTASCAYSVTLKLEMICSFKTLINTQRHGVMSQTMGFIMCILITKKAEIICNVFSWIRLWLRWRKYLYLTYMLV